MKWTSRAPGLCAALLAGEALAADRICQGAASDWPGQMTVTLRIDSDGKIKDASSRLRLGAEDVQFPLVMVEYEMASPRESRLGDITYVSVGAIVNKEQNPKSKWAEIVVSVDDKQTWSRPWGLYAQQDWSVKGKDGAEAVGFFGLIPLEARESGIGKAMETGQFLAVAVRGVEARETFGYRQHALARRDVVQPLADQAHAIALGKLANYRKACEAVKG